MSSPQPLQGVQVLRFAAALMVVIHHALEGSIPLFGGSAPADYWVRFGASGVDVFFVISGFIMLHTSWQQFGRAGAVRQFIRRRLTRIFPLYWLCLAIVLLAWGSGALYRSLAVDGPSLVGAVLLLPIGHPLIGVAWTLVFEMIFYAVFAAWLSSQTRLRGVLGIVTTMAMLWACASLWASGALLRYLGSPMLFEFCLGLGVAAAWRHKGRHLSPLVLLALMALGLAMLMYSSAWAPAHGTAGLDESTRAVAWGLPAGLLVYASLNWEHRNGWLARSLEEGGNASYALYLTHPFVMVTYAKFIKSGHGGTELAGGNAWIGVAIATVLSVMLGYGVHRWVETPLLDRMRPMRPRHTPATNAP